MTIAAVLDRADEPAVGKMKVQALLEALPKVGKVKASEAMTELEIAENRRVAGLGDGSRRDCWRGSRRSLLEGTS